MSLGIFKNGMKKVYHYIFYKLYRYMLTTPNSNLALNGAVIYLSIGLLFNSITINLLLNKFFKLYAMSGNSFLIYYFNHWYFKKDNLYLKIEERFSVESKRQKALGNIFVFVFVVGSVIFFMLTGYVVNKYFGGFK